MTTKILTVKMKYVFLLATLMVVSQQTFGSIQWVDIGVNGLTCSLCTRSVEKSISKLDFVEKVEMDLETTNGRVYLRKDLPFSLEKIAKAVVDAGFSVQYVKVLFNLTDLTIDPQGSFVDGHHQFQWINYERTTTKRQVVLKIVNEGFLPRKEALVFKKKTDLLSKGKNATLYGVEEN